MNLIHFKTLLPILLLMGLSLFSQSEDRPNVILVMTDDQGYGDLSCHGNPILKTPHLDQMYSESVRFTDFHVSSFCTPTRAALMTGNYPAKTGAYRTSAGRTMMHPDEKTIAHHFSDNGYATGMVGKWHLGDNAPHRPQDRGFQDVVWHRCGGIGQASDYWGNDYFDDTYERNGTFEKFEGYCTDVWFREAMRFVSENKEKPFFLYLALNAPHGPYRVPEEWAAPYKDVEGVVNPNFMGMVANIDHNMGLLRGKLNNLKLADNTILIFMTDNGTSAGAKFDGLESEPVVGFNAGMRGKKSSVYEGGHRVPFFIHWPKGGLTGGKDIETIGAHIDVLPTLAELCGLPKPDDTYQLDGLSLVPLLKGKRKDWTRNYHVEQYHCGPHNRLPIEPFHYTTVLTEKWRLIKASKDVVELYDIEKDRAQRNNLADQHPEVVAKLKEHYQEYWKKVRSRMTPVSIDIGNPNEPVTELCSQDWFMLGGNPPWNFGSISKLPKVSLPWKVEVKSAGRYKFTLRQWPKVADKPLVAKRAVIEIAGRTAETEVPHGSKGIQFELELPAGKTDLNTWLYNEKNEAGGAYFTEVEFLGASQAAPAAPSNEAKAHAVIVVGTHHYSPQRTMPPFAKELERLGFSTEVVNPDWDPEKDARGLPGLEALAEADIAIFFTRFLKINDEQLKHITRYLESGKPVVGFRTSTHGFNYPKDHPQVKWNHGFGKDALGTPYLIHLAGSTQLKLAEGAKNHPIFTGVGDPDKWVSPGTLYLTKLEPNITPLLIGTGKSKSDKPSVRTNQFGTHQLQPEMTDTVAWTWKNKWGGRTFSTSLGHTGDFTVPESMRFMVNGVFWAAGLPVPRADTEINTLKLAPASRKNTQPATRKSKSNPKAPTPAQPAEQVMDVPKIKSDGVTLFYGNSFVERLQEDGTFEALLHASDPTQHYQFRSLAYTGDEVGFRIRPAKFGNHLGYISSQLTCNRVVMCFGMNEAFAGADGLTGFERDLRIYIDLIKGRHPGSEYILVSPTAVEEQTERNTDIESYTQIMAKVSAELGIDFINLFEPSKKLFAEKEQPLTQNGLHLNQAGNQLVAKLLAEELGSKTDHLDTTTRGFERLRELVSRKAYEVAMAYKPANGIHYYGLRARDYEYAAEIPHHLRLANQLDQVIWQQAKDLSKAITIPELKTAVAVAPQKPPRKGLGIIKTAEQDLQDFTVADGFEVNAFASSEDFPDLINPLQIHTDANGRIWVCCFASYPVPLPGTLANDKILILEDTDGDGKADKQTVFADKLKLPDGFVFYKDGIVVSVARKLIWLRDTDGDDIADVRTELLRGADDTDTHHGGYLSRTPQGDIILTEALFHRGQFETPQGPLRTKNVAILHFDPITRGLSVERQTSHPNPWKISWNDRGEAIQMYGGGQIIDCDYYNVDMPIGTSSSSAHGMPFRDDKGCTIEFVSSKHFPEDWQGGVVTGHLLGKNTILYTPLEYRDGIMAGAATPLPLLTSSNKIFRPTDLEFGLDGALYVSDFYYPIIGHAQHSIRDENRDYSNGRIWRVTRKGASLSTPPKIDGVSISELFSLLTHPQVTVRELARFELENRPDDEVITYAKSQLPSDNSKLSLEILWLFERLGEKAGADLFKSLVSSGDPKIRRAAAKSLRTWSSQLGEDAKEIAKGLAGGGDRRTLVSLISTASYLQTSDPWWADFIQGIPAEDNTPIDKMKQLASLYNAPPLSREFPLLSVSPDCNLTGWLPSNVGAGGGSIFVTSEKSQSAILGFRGNPYLNVNFNGIPLYREAGSVHVKDGQMTIDLVEGINHIEYFERVKGKRGGRIDLYLADLTGEVPNKVGFAKNPTEHQSWSKSWNDRYATVSDSRIYIKAVPSQMAFNVKTFTVEPGKEYQFVFENPDHMLHNILITTPGHAEVIGEMADKMAAQTDGMAKHFVPENEAVLFSTEQIPHGATVEKTFVTPKEAGSYPFICTFPGHWRLMRGEMIVAAKQTVAPEPAAQPAATSKSAPILLPEVKGQFVRIELPGEKRTLSLAEVKVYEKGKNMALKKKATQSTVDHGGEPAKAVDGNTDGNYQKGSVTHSKPNDNSPWWEVDLGKTVNIEEVAVYNRDSLGSRLDGFTLKVLDTNRKEVFVKEKVRQSELITFLKRGIQPSRPTVSKQLADSESEPQSENPFPGERIDFRGYDRYDRIKTEHGHFSIVCPKKPAPGKPWLWRSLFWEAIKPVSNADLKLVDEGYHVVLAHGDVAGHPKGNANIDAAYDLLTTQYGFSKKCSMASISRGTLSLFRWASNNPEKVESIYVDNGVCNVLSWPAGKLVPGNNSIASGAAESWADFKRKFGYQTDEEALKTKESPIDQLKPLAREGVPILMVCGNKDTAVPYEENDAIMEQRYKALGGDITVIVENKGHSHGMKDPTPVLEFIRKNTQAALTMDASIQPDDSWIIENHADWVLATGDHNNLEITDGMAKPTAKEATYRSKLKTFEKLRKATSITFDQSPVWHNWDPIQNLGPTNLGDAPVMLSLGPDNYWMFGRYGGKGKKGFQAKEAKLEGFDLPLKTTPFSNQYDAPGGLQPGHGGYHAWQSKDMLNWVHHGAVTERFSSWVTTAEYADGKLYIYYDYPNDQDPHLYIDEDLTDGLPGKNMGMAFEDPSHGSDCTFIRDLDGNFHVIYEDWSPINASKHSWDSPLAGHAISRDGIGNFKILEPAVDERTKPTGKFAEYPHPHWHATAPEKYPAKKAPEDVPQHRIKKGQARAYGKYEIHEPEQNAYGDWASICIGGQYYLFADFHPANDKIRVGWFTSSSIDKPFTFCGEIGNGHPDPDIMFAEGKFYLATQQSTDYISSGPWVESVKVRVGVDIDNDGKSDQWTDWQEVKERYDYIPGFSKQVAKTPAKVDLSELPEGHGFQFEVQLTDTTENSSKPILDSVKLLFE